MPTEQRATSENQEQAVNVYAEWHRANIPGTILMPLSEYLAALDVSDAAGLLNVKAVAALLSCSTRHVYRLADEGKMPPPVKLGALIRWRRQAIETWLAEGCPTCRNAGR